MPQNFGDVLTPTQLDDLVQYLIDNTPAGGSGSSKSGG